MRVFTLGRLYLPAKDINLKNVCHGSVRREEEVQNATKSAAHYTYHKGKEDIRLASIHPTTCNLQPLTPGLFVSGSQTWMGVGHVSQRQHTRSRGDTRPPLVFDMHLNAAPASQ